MNKRLLSICLFCFCNAVADESYTGSVPANFPQTYYSEHASSPNMSVFQVDTQKSIALIYVFREGLLGAFGHNHVVATHTLHGYIALDKQTQAYRADVYVPVGQLTVDEPALRAAAHLDSQPSSSDIRGTRDNMLEYVLEEKKFPFVQVHLKEWRTNTKDASVELTLHGTRKTIIVPVTAEIMSDSVARVRGRFSLRQSDYGIAPYSAFGGLLKVRDRVDIEFTLAANQL